MSTFSVLTGTLSVRTEKRIAKTEGKLEVSNEASFFRTKFATSTHIGQIIVNHNDSFQNSPKCLMDIVFCDRSPLLQLGPPGVIHPCVSWHDLRRLGRRECDAQPLKNWGLRSPKLLDRSLIETVVHQNG